jgi:hypothetical protein
MHSKNLARASSCLASSELVIIGDNLQIASNPLNSAMSVCPVPTDGHRLAETTQVSGNPGQGLWLLKDDDFFSKKHLPPPLKTVGLRLGFGVVGRRSSQRTAE